MWSFQMYARYDWLNLFFKLYNVLNVNVLYGNTVNLHNISTTQMSGHILIDQQLQKQRLTETHLFVTLLGF